MPSAIFLDFSKQPDCFEDFFRNKAVKILVIYCSNGLFMPSWEKNPVAEFFVSVADISPPPYPVM